jgi:DNA invertase Pin-like site-specific DNA recombinase
MATKAIGYTRVSTAGQYERGKGLPAQRAAIRAECERKGWHLVAVTGEDAGRSGKSADRAGLRDVLDRMDAGEAHVLVVSELNRIVRSVAQGAAIIERAVAHGWEIISLDAKLDTTTPSGRLVANIMLAVGQHERELVGQRTRAALAPADVRAKISRNTLAGLDRARAAGKTLGRPGAGEATVARIRTEHAAGASLRQIAASLEADGVLTSRGNTRWHASSVRAILDAA